jgi:hypothetical protein
MHRNATRALLFTTLTLTAGCGGADPNATVRTDSSGIAVIRNTGEYHPISWSFTPEFKLGADSGQDSYGRVRENTVQVSPDGHIFVLDTDAKRVYIYDQAGREITRIESTAAQPLRVPAALVLTDDGFAIFDAELVSFMRYSTDGSYLGTTKAPRQFKQGVIDSDSGAFVLTQRLTDPATQKPVLSIIRVSPTDTTYVIAAQIDPEIEVSFRSCPVRMFMTPLFAEPPAWDAGYGLIAVAEAPTYGVRLYREGQEVKRIRRHMPPEPATNQFALLAAGQGRDVRLYTGETCTIPAQEIALGSGWKDVIPAIGAIRITPERGLWLQRVDPGRALPAVDIIDPNGEYVGTLGLGTPWPVAFLPGDRPLVLEDDSLGVTHLVAYRIDKTPQQRSY